ncbi:hypothetical protein CC1G_11236 [Coprinopsis cinerea okayama7|uniref:Uncharacterized protein n=1 Tax=Coprinopsis cinerea (strain Okayama-7 / 130 / ATCC MYA-4618 / FGSC 9003) TaxID=240176 RepID=A8N135_COPC7|nr:hypothetical protein CC1G_11236 [Coprinopsis cinerea okayama7\|eukprot:XP_001828584.2 hypothetical protein CC1G_11236 [Coprinopsis cinerea okayama7\
MSSVLPPPTSSSTSFAPTASTNFDTVHHPTSSPTSSAPTSSAGPDAFTSSSSPGTTSSSSSSSFGESTSPVSSSFRPSASQSTAVSAIITSSSPLLPSLSSPTTDPSTEFQTLSSSTTSSSDVVASPSSSTVLPSAPSASPSPPSPHPILPTNPPSTTTRGPNTLPGMSSSNSVPDVDETSSVPPPPPSSTPPSEPSPSPSSSPISTPPPSSSRSPSSTGSPSSSTRPPSQPAIQQPPPPTSTITSVSVIRQSGGSERRTSTVTIDPETTLSTPVVLTLTVGGEEITTAPSFVTVVHTSTELDGDVVLHTEIAANPRPSDDSTVAPSGGILNNKGAAAGIFVSIGIVSSIIAFLLLMIWRRRRRTERRKRWFAGMRQHRPAESTGSGYAFNHQGGQGGSGKSSPFEGLRVEKTVEDDRGDDRNFHGGNGGIQVLPWGTVPSRQPSPPRQHYRPHSTLNGPSNGNYTVGMGAAADSVSTLGLTGIGSAMYGFNQQNGSVSRANGVPSPVRKPVSPHLYDEELKDLDTMLNKAQLNRSNSTSEPTNAIRTRFGLSPIVESGNTTTKAPESLSVPPSSYHFNPRYAPSPVPSSPSLYPPTLDEDSPYTGYDDDYDDDCRNLFYQKPALSPTVPQQVATSLPAPPRPPRSRLRDSAASVIGTTKSTVRLAPSLA